MGLARSASRLALAVCSVWPVTEWAAVITLRLQALRMIGAGTMSEREYITDSQLLDMIEGICETAIKGQSLDGKVGVQVIEWIARLAARRSTNDAATEPK